MRSDKRLRRGTHEGDMGMGMISLFALIVILCMAVLSVLAFSTAHSSLVLSQRQAEATQELYLNEAAAQEFMAGLDGTDPAGVDLGSLCAEAERSVDGAVEATAALEDDGAVHAEFSSPGGRTLEIELSPEPGGGLSIESWRMKAAEVEEPAIGTLYSVGNEG